MAGAGVCSSGFIFFAGDFIFSLLISFRASFLFSFFLSGSAGLFPGETCDPDHVNRQTSTEELEDLMYVLNKYLPGIFESVVTSKTCLYSNTTDENFIIDKLPGFEDHVTIACGFSGHGFKFASVIGEILADLAIDGVTKEPVDFLSMKRFL